MDAIQRVVKVISLLLICSALHGCGGGGGGSDLNQGKAAAGNPVQATIQVSPRLIDSGDVMNVDIRIENVVEEFQLKIRTPSAFSLVKESALLLADGHDSTRSPAIAVFPVDEALYIVLFLEPDFFGEEEAGVLSLQIRGDAATEGPIELDIDTDDEVTNDNIEFDRDNPRFTAIDEVRIEVVE